MIVVRTGELAEIAAGAVLRPVAADFSSVTPMTRRLELAAGPTVADQCAQLGELPLGSASITSGGDLVAEFMVHVAVSSRDEPVRPSVIRKGLKNGLRRLADLEIDSVAMPLLGTGAGNLDAEDAVRILLEVVREHETEQRFPSRIIVVAESAYEVEVAEQAIEGSAAGGRAG